MKRFFNRRASNWISLVCFCFGAFWAYKTVSSFCKKQTDGFTIEGISSNRSFDPAWDVHPLTKEEREELDLALAQKYHYLACGNQAFAFLSDDRRYVIKFFNQKLFEPPFLLKWLPLKWLNEGRSAKKLWKKEDKLHRDFSSYRLAFDELKEETGLVFVHLNPSDWLQRNLVIRDKLNIEHSIPLDRFNFIIQKRADLVFPTIDRLMNEGNIAAARGALSSILHLFVSRCQKGIFDSDPDLDKNFGFIGEHAVQIDIGRFARHAAKVKYSQRHVAQQMETSEVTPPVIKETFKTWLLENHPLLFEHFMTEYDTLCHEKKFTPA